MPRSASFYSSNGDVSKTRGGNVRIVHISLLKTKYCLSFICILRKSKDVTHPYKFRGKKMRVRRAGTHFHTRWRHMRHHLSVVLF